MTTNTIAEYVKDTLEKSRLAKKCMAFTEDNCNTMFGGLRHNEHGSIVFAKSVHHSPSGVGCPSHLLNNCIHHGADQMSVNIKNSINKIQCFSIYCSLLPINFNHVSINFSHYRSNLVLC